MLLICKLVGVLFIPGLGFSFVNGVEWNLTQTINATNFAAQFNWYNESDPTHGLVNYQNYTASVASKTTVVKDGVVYMGVDISAVIPANAKRNSVRVTSKQSYSDGIYVLDVTHIPQGCAVWPAFWTVTSNISTWPVGGEIDILENANDQFVGNLATVHTKSNCIVGNSTTAWSGYLVNANCSALAANNVGCQTSMTGSGTPLWKNLNAAGGGIYAMERSMGSTGNGVRVWYWQRYNAPANLASDSTSVDPTTWGTPGASFNIANNCHSQFGPHNIVFDITLCGDWAGAASYTQSGCSKSYKSCASQVANNGSSFSQAYWGVNSIKIFGTGGNTTNSALSPNTKVQVNNAISTPAYTAPKNGKLPSTSSSTKNAKFPASLRIFRLYWFLLSIMIVLFVAL